MPKRKNIPKPNVDAIHQMLKDRGTSQRELGRMLGLDPAAAYNLTHGKRALQLSEALTLAKTLSLPFETILELWRLPKAGLEGAIGTKEGAEDGVKVIGYLDAALIVRREGVKGKRSAPAPNGERAKGLAALRFQTAETEYGAWDGAMLFYRAIAQGSVPASMIGRFAIVKPEGMAELRLRQIRRGYETGRYDLAGLSGRVLEESITLAEVFAPVAITF
jgi:hypothetical protein